jgi:hypothetical protein
MCVIQRLQVIPRSRRIHPASGRGVMGRCPTPSMRKVDRGDPGPGPGVRASRSPSSPTPVRSVCPVARCGRGAHLFRRRTDRSDATPQYPAPASVSTVRVATPASSARMTWRVVMPTSQCHQHSDDQQPVRILCPPAAWQEQDLRRHQSGDHRHRRVAQHPQQPAGQVGRSPISPRNENRSRKVPTASSAITSQIVRGVQRHRRALPFHPRRSISGAGAIATSAASSRPRL